MTIWSKLALIAIPLILIIQVVTDIPNDDRNGDHQ